MIRLIAITIIQTTLAVFCFYLGYRNAINRVKKWCAGCQVLRAISENFWED